MLLWLVKMGAQQPAVSLSTEHWLRHEPSAPQLHSQYPVARQLLSHVYSAVQHRLESPAARQAVSHWSKRGPGGKRHLAYTHGGKNNAPCPRLWLTMLPTMVTVSEYWNIPVSMSSVQCQT